MPGVVNIADQIASKFEQAHSIAVFYMFLQEEAIQASCLACFVAYQNENYEEMRQLARYTKEQLAEPLKDLADSKLGKLAYPVNNAFSDFAEAQIKSLNYYIELEPSGG